MRCNPGRIMRAHALSSGALGRIPLYLTELIAINLSEGHGLIEVVN